MKTTRYILTLLIAVIMTATNAWGAITPTAPSQDANGVYQIGTAEELWGFAAIVNGTNGFTQNLSACAVLTADIDMGGEAKGSFPGMGNSNTSCYAGTFDGAGHTISNYYQNTTGSVYRSGFFTCIKGASVSNKAVVKNFTIKGKKDYSGTMAMHGVVVGDVSGYGLVEDVNCEVNVTATNAVAIWGGLVGTVLANGTVNRCRYSGTFTCGPLTDRIGGIVGEIRGGTVSNCLFDGTISNNNANIKLGGIIGGAQTSDGSKINNCFSHGTITLGASAGSNVGIVMGHTQKTVTFTDTYYTTTNATNVSDPFGSTISATATNVTGSEDITNGSLRDNLGQYNWKQDTNYPIPGETKHEHDYGTSGICSSTVGDCDARYQSAALDGEVYKVANAGQLLWWANKVNKGEIAKSSNVQLTGDCDITGETWPEITGYTGTFDGQGHTISGYTCTNSATTTAGVGFFFNTSGATLKRFTLEGTFNITGASNNSAFMGTVVGKAVNTTLEDVTSTVTINTDATINGTQNSGLRLVGGLVGDANGCTINRCRYNGIMTLDASTTAVGDRFGGIVGSVQTGATTISNCLFDGKFDLKKNSIILGGILGRQLSGTASITNCLSVGELRLKTANTSCGMIIGNHNAETITNCHYITSKVYINEVLSTTGMNTYGTSNSGTNMAALQHSLNGGESVTDCNWKVVTGQEYPIPMSWQKTQYTITFNDYDGTLITKKYVEPGQKLTLPADPTRTGCDFAGWTPEVVMTPTEDATYTATYTLAKYTLTFDVKGGTAIVPVTQDYNTTYTLPTAVKTGYSFDEWNTEADGTGTSYAAGDIYTITADATLYAQYTYVPNAQGIFEIATQEDLFNFATYVNNKNLGQDNGHGNANAKLIADITLDGTPFPGIGQYKTKTSGNTKEVYYLYTAEGNKWTDVSGGTLNDENTQYTKGENTYPYGGHPETIDKKPTEKEDGKVYCVTENIWVKDPSYAYSGTFDGQGHTITGYVRNVTTDTNQGGFFNYVNGATIKKFSLAGTMTVSCANGQQYGSVVGWSEAGSTIEDVHSSVNVNITSTAAQVGGFTGRAGGTYNRCRYNGTVSTSTAYNKIGGFAGSHRNGTTTNCLFDGTLNISTTVPEGKELIAGGFISSVIEAVPNNITNCLTHGTISITNKNAKCGIIFGYADKNITLTNTWYTTTNAPGLNAVGTVTNATMTGDAQERTTQPWVDIYVALNNGSSNWGVQSKEYPVPGESAPTTYTLTFNTDGGTTIEPIKLPAGAAVTAPANPSKTGYTFDKWVDENGVATTIPTTMPAENKTFKATWTKNQYHVYYYVDGALYHTDTYVYNAETTTLTAPTKDRYTFSGWDTTIPDNMPANDITVHGTFTYSANAQGVYEIGNKEDFFNFVTVASTNASANAKLIADIDLDKETFNGFNAYAGTFDGNNHTISNYKRTNSTTTTAGVGFFNTTAAGATIKNLKIDGKLTITGATNNSAFLGGLVGIANGTSFIDITCSIDVETDNTVDGSTLYNRIRILGGMVGQMVGGSMNRCRYNGTMTFDSNTDDIGDRFGGLIGLMLTTASTIDNCLFDGTITANKNSIIIGGLVGNGLAVSTIKNSLAAGKLNLTSINTNCGMLIGSTKPSTFTNNHYVKDCIKVGGSVVSSGYNDAGTLNDGTNWVGLQNTLNGGVETVECNWKIVAGQAYPIPMAWSNNHTHTWDANGFCVDGDGGYQSLDAPVESVYQIKNGGQLYDFVLKINAGTIPMNSNAKLTKDINLCNVEFPGIGTYTSDASRAYSGTFDGQDHTISGYNRKVTSGNQQGFFNYAKGATIKGFTLKGTMTDSGNGQQHGSVIGWSDAGTTVEDVHSSVNVTFTSTASQAGGFAGRTTGTINRCSYSGTVSSSTAYNKIGGFIGCIYGGTLKNCLFDGTLSLSSDDTGLIAGGLVGAFIDSNVGQIQNSLSHGTVTIPNYTNGKCGIVVGLVDRNSSMSMTLYTTTGATEGLTAAVGSVTTNYKLTGTPKDVTSDYTWEEVNIMLNPSEGTTGNWKIQTGDGAKTYPVPMLVKNYTHTHTYKNGFCISEDGNYQSTEKDDEGYYMIANGGNLWWIAEQLNSGTLNNDINIKLTADIDMEGDVHGSFPGICEMKNNDWDTGFQGIFDGKGHTINNYYYYNNKQTRYRLGMFNIVRNATIKHFNINGTMVAINSQIQGVVVGSASGQSVIEDINSTVAIESTGAFGVGGIVGALENNNNQPLTKMNRCRYNGTITLNGTNNRSIGGVCGELRSALIYNTLFDGTITAADGVGYVNIGGVVGKVSTSDNSEMHRILSHGTISLAGYTADSKSGVVVGAAEKTLYLYRVYHTTNTDSLPYIGPHLTKKTITNEKDGTVGAVIDLELLLGESIDKTEHLDDLYSPEFRLALGDPNWAKVSSDYTYPLKDPNHIHKYSNGFCTSGDGEYERPNQMGNTFKIRNGGQLYWFAENFNNGDIKDADGNEVLNPTVEIMNDIDMEGDDYIFPGIGTYSRRFQGTFEGHDYAISGFKRNIINGEGTGLINYAIDATIEDFTLYGEINFNLATVKSFHGTVVGMAIGKNTKIEDVFSFVNINCQNANTRVLGGIAGRTSGHMNRCRYQGTIKGMGDTASESGRQIGGIIANAREEILIENCLFDGVIRVTCQEADTMRVSGILASNEKNSGVRITIKNCLFNGCLQLKHTYEQGTHGTNPKSTENGIIAGYWDSNLPSVINNVYYLKSCTGMDDIPLGKFQTYPNKDGETWNETPGVVTEIVGTPTNEQWNDIFKKLDEYNEETGDRNGNWIYDVDNAGKDGHEELPVPGVKKCPHYTDDSYFNEFGYCTICGLARPLQQDKEDGKYKMEFVSDLDSFRELVNSGDISAGTVLNAKLTQDIDFANFTGDFGEPIGNSHFNRYLYNFDGQGYSLLNVKITTKNDFVGFFGFVGDPDHDSYIHDFTITGTIEVPYESKANDDKPLYMGVIGKMFRGKIENVHSEMVMKNTNVTHAKIGGILGAAETEDSYSVTITKCSFTGTYEANAYGEMGGIVGETSKNTLVDHCTFAGVMDHTYKGSNNTTKFGGIVGYNEESTFKGVKNCVIAGTLKTDGGRTFVDYGTVGNSNHKNILSGEDKVLTDMLTTKDDAEYIARYANCYALTDYKLLIPSNTKVVPNYVSNRQFANGEVCAALNALETNFDPQDGYPWRQILGYQLGSNKTAGSPAQRLPFPGYQNPEKKVYLVKKDASNNYLADWYFFDDKGDETLFPTDASTMKVKKIEYHRDAQYLYGYNSFVLPFEFTQAMKNDIDANGKIYLYDRTEENLVKFTEKTDGSVSGGTPFILEASRNGNWDYILEDPEGTPVAMTVSNAAGEGLYGSFDKFETGWGYWKLREQGDYFVQTIGIPNGPNEPANPPRDKPRSYCYPFRAYVKLPSASPVKEYIPIFDGIEDLDTQYPEGPAYNIMGQRVGKNAKGMVIINGRKYLRK